MNWTKQELSEHERKQLAQGFTGALSDLVDKPARDPGEPRWNKTEARYAQYLDLQQRTGAVLWWAFEGITFKLAPDTRYTPDFAVMTPSGKLECHEVKGAKNGKPRYEDDARVKIAVAAEKFRMIRFVMVWPARNGEWDSKDF